MYTGHSSHHGTESLFLKRNPILILASSILLLGFTADADLFNVVKDCGVPSNALDVLKTPAMRKIMTAASPCMKAFKHIGIYGDGRIVFSMLSASLYAGAPLWYIFSTPVDENAHTLTGGLSGFVAWVIHEYLNQSTLKPALSDHVSGRRPLEGCSAYFGAQAFIENPTCQTQYKLIKELEAPGMPSGHSFTYGFIFGKELIHFISMIMRGKCTAGKAIRSLLLMFYSLGTVASRAILKDHTLAQTIAGATGGILVGVVTEIIFAENIFCCAALGCAKKIGTKLTDCKKACGWINRMQTAWNDWVVKEKCNSCCPKDCCKDCCCNDCCLCTHRCAFISTGKTYEDVECNRIRIEVSQGIKDADQEIKQAWDLAKNGDTRAIEKIQAKTKKLLEKHVLRADVNKSLSDVLNMKASEIATTITEFTKPVKAKGCIPVDLTPTRSDKRDLRNAQHELIQTAVAKKCLKLKEGESYKPDHNGEFFKKHICNIEKGIAVKKKHPTLSLDNTNQPTDGGAFYKKAMRERLTDISDNKEDEFV